MTTLRQGLPEPPLSRLFEPRTIAVVGAHDSRAGLREFTRRVLDKAESCGAAIYLVNPKLPSVNGIDTYGALEDIPPEIDVLVILVGDAAGVLEEAAACARKPLFTIVFAGGYAEVGTPAGRERHDRLVRAARSAGTRLLGPNTNVNILEPLQQLAGPRLGLVTQSGMQGRPIAQGQEMGIALSGWAVTGNEADLDAADFIRYMAIDPGTSAIAAYVEGFTDGDRLRQSALVALETHTPIVLIKVGRSAAGAQASLTHTGHLAGTDSVHDAFFRQYGITRVDDLDQLLEVAVGLSRSTIPTRRGVGLLCTSGGSAAHIADLFSASGLLLPPLAAATQDRLHVWIPQDYEVCNPVDNGGVALLEGHGPEIAETMLSDESIGLLVIPVTGVFPPHMPHVLNTVAHARTVSEKPVIVIWSGPTTNATYQALMDLGVAVVRNVDKAVRTVQALLALSDIYRDGGEFRKAAASLGALARPTPDRLETLDEQASTAWLEERGLRFAEHATVHSLEAAKEAADRIGYPVVLKALGGGVVHKTEAGRVALGLLGPEDMESAAAEMLQHSGADPVEGWLVARHLRGGVELLVGLTQDRQFGPVVTVGAGGVKAEMLNDVVSAVLPLTRRRASEMLEEIRIAPLLSGYRGSPPVDKDAVVDVLLRLAEIGADPAVEEIDVNPLLALPDRALGLDAVVRVAARPDVPK